VVVYIRTRTAKSYGLAVLAFFLDYNLLSWEDNEENESESSKNLISNLKLLVLD